MDPGGGKTGGPTGGEEEWEDFGQQVSLTARIREILLNYPESSVLKEMIQVTRAEGRTPPSTPPHPPLSTPLPPG